LEDNGEVSNYKIEEDPNQENVLTVKIVQKAEMDQHPKTEAQVPVTGAADLTKACVQQLTRNVITA
jgi:hypothetical protein